MSEGIKLCQDCHREYKQGKSDIYCNECCKDHKEELERARQSADRVRQRERERKQKERERKIQKASGEHWGGLRRKERMELLQELEYQDYLKTPWWKLRRRMKLKRVGYKCEKCGSKKRLQVHHIRYTKVGGEKMKDLKVLCRNCHLDEHPAIRDANEIDKQYQKVTSG